MSDIPRITSSDLTSGFPEMWNALAEDVEQQRLAINAGAAHTRDVEMELRAEKVQNRKRAFSLADQITDLRDDLTAVKWAYGIALFAVLVIGLFT